MRNNILNLIFLVTSFLIGEVSKAQITFKKAYPAVNSNGYSAIQTLDGGYLFVGNEMQVVKCDSLGDIQWANNYLFGNFTSAFRALQNADSSYVILCLDPDPSILKLSPSGDTLWAKKYDVSIQSWSINPTYDGGYILPYDGGVFKLDGNGNVQWATQYDIYEALYVEQTSDSGFIITGICPDSLNIQGKDLFLIKTDSLGNSLWSKCYYTTYNEWGDCVHQTSDGGYIISGWRDTIPGLLAIKTDSSGDTLWTSALDLSGTRHDCIVKNSGNYIIVFTDGLVELNAYGDTVWAKRYQSINGLSGDQTSDGGFIFCGGSGQMTSMKTDSMGNNYCGEISLHPQKVYPEFSVKNYSLSVSHSLPTFITTSVQVSNAISEYTYCELAVTNYQIPPEITPLLFPNPAGNKISFSTSFEISYLEIINLIGEKCLAFSLPATNCLLPTSIDVSFLLPGIYFLRAETEHETVTAKFIKE